MPEQNFMTNNSEEISVLRNFDEVLKPEEGKIIGMFGFFFLIFEIFWFQNRIMI